MLKRNYLILLLLLTSLSLPFWFEDKEVKLQKQHVKETAIEAKNHYVMYGKEEAYKLFQNVTEHFVEGEYYVFVFENTTCLVHPTIPELVNRNLKELTDPTGKYFIKDFLKLMKKKKQGWVSYLWPNPNTMETSAKYSFLIRLEDKPLTYLGVGFYKNKTD